MRAANSLIILDKIEGSFRHCLNHLMVCFVVLAICIPIAAYWHLNTLTKIPEIPRFSSAQLKYSVDKCEIDSRRFLVDGWIYIPGELANGVVSIYIKRADGGYYGLKSRVKERKDVEQAFRLEGLAHRKLGFNGSSGDLRPDIVKPIELTLVRRDSSGKIHGVSYVCK